MSSPEPGSQVILTLSCGDRPGIVHTVTGFLVEENATILSSQQFNDRESGRFFMRIQFTHADGIPLIVDDLAERFQTVAEKLGLTWRMADAVARSRVLVLVSKAGHCLNDLLFRNSIGELRLDVAAIVSNHPDLGKVADNYDVPFHHIPVTPATKPAAEAALWGVVERERIELVILARYMQILSDELCTKLSGRAINIHHSILPSFKGARPYHQAHRRGVKLIGATAHYVTADLDEGPIIDQQQVAVDHSMSGEEFVAGGREVEARALARAVRWHTENRIIVHDGRTVVLR
jgi:formyltetrahydrofolate deformylase